MIEAAGSRLSFVGCGSIQTDAATSLAERLAGIHRLLTGLVEREGPHEAAIEETFINRDPQSALKLGQARGVALATLRSDRPAGRGIRRQSHQEDGGRRRPRGKAAGGDDGEDAVAGLDRVDLGRSRRARVAICHAQHRAARAQGRGMIGKLKGIVDSVDEEALILDVNGVGYLVSASARTLRALPGVGKAAELLIETHVREDAIKLYGFLTAGERDWFRLLQSVQGVGAKVALGILGALSADALERGDRAAGQGDDGARAGRRPEARRAPRARAQGQGAGDWRRRFRATRTRVCERAPKLAEGGRGRGARPRWPRLRPGPGRRRGGQDFRSARPAAETAALIRAGLKELAQ